MAWSPLIKSERRTICGSCVVSSASELTDQLQGWGTAGAAVVALAALIAAIFAYHTQSVQLRLQQQQIRDQAEVQQLQVAELREAIRERRRQEIERQREQAIQVYIVEEKREVIDERGRLCERVVALVRNASSLPVQDLAVVWHEGEQELRGSVPPYLMPGGSARHEYIGVEGVSVVPPAGVFATALFRDAAGLRWEITTEDDPRLLSETP